MLKTKVHFSFTKRSRTKRDKNKINSLFYLLEFKYQKFLNIIYENPINFPFHYFDFAINL
jgi:hypothetical protein